MNELAIKISDLTKSYGQYKAVKNINFTVNKGELFGFLGPNGAGKTTTIKMMTGLLEPTSGSVHIHGINMWIHPLEAKKRIAYVPDQPNLYPKLTGWEYLEFIASVFNLEEDRFQKRALELLTMFDLKDRANELIESYSHGMKQKMAITGALIHDPAVLFLDEPTVGLDPKSARLLKNILKDACQQGMTVFLTTHILEIAEQLCDRIGIIQDGQMIALGTIDELRSKDGQADRNLEDIFLELTGGADQEAMINEMAKEESGEA